MTNNLALVKDDKNNSSLVSRNITVLDRRTSVRLEPEMWAALHDIATRERCKINDVCSLIENQKHHDTSLTAAIRVFLMLYYRAAATEDGHRKAGHGNFVKMKERAKATNGSGEANNPPDKSQAVAAKLGNLNADDKQPSAVGKF